MHTRLAYSNAAPAPHAATRRHEVAHPAAATHAAVEATSGPDWQFPPRKGLRARLPLLLVLSLHALAAWGLLHALRGPAPVLKPKPEPVQLRLVMAAPATLPEAAAQRVAAPTMAALPRPASIEPLQVQVRLASPAPTAAAMPVVAADAHPTEADKPAAAPAGQAPAGARVHSLPAGAVRYLREPQLHVPKMSQRLRESGLVLLRIQVDPQGQLREASVKRSSGFERLDQQALQDIRSARFAPYLVEGQAVAWEAEAGLQYEVR